MQFREYRRKETIRAAEISEGEIKLLVADGSPEDVVPFNKGDYVELRDGKLLGWSKETFELNFAAIRAPRQASNGQKRKRKASAATTTTS